MIISKILKNQIIKIVKDIIGGNGNKWEIRKMQTEVRGIRSTVSRLRKIVDSKLDCKCMQCNCRLEKKDA